MDLFMEEDHEGMVEGGRGGGAVGEGSGQAIKGALERLRGTLPHGGGDAVRARSGMTTAGVEGRAEGFEVKGPVQVRGERVGETGD